MTVSTGGEQAPLDQAAYSVITGTQRLFSGTPRLPMTQEEKTEAKRIVQNGFCSFCGGIHVGMSTPACPRLASGKLNGDGTVIEFTYWQDWDISRVVFPEDIEDDADEIE